jgi:hypothetical protein
VATDIDSAAPTRIDSGLPTNFCGALATYLGEIAPTRIEGDVLTDFDSDVSRQSAPATALSVSTCDSPPHRAGRADPYLAHSSAIFILMMEGVQTMDRETMGNTTLRGGPQ